MTGTSSTTRRQTADREAELSETAQSIQEHLKQYKLTVYDAARFPGFVSDVDRINSFIRKGIGHSLDAAMDLESFHKDKEEKLSDKLARRIQGGEAICDVVDAYEQEWKREKAKYRAMSDKKKYHTHPQFEDYRITLWSVNHPDEPLPPFTPGDEKDDEGDDDLVVGPMKRSLKCPLTQKWLENPVTSKLCRHTFSKREIFAFISRKGGRTSCPVPGCVKILDHASFYEDTMVERMVARAREEDSIHQSQTSFYDVE
ncbi:zinc-finger of the MIZ type in Nse subunit-domain-containing protein [Dichotomocladium elegans]|nr:zinc-finger of the MIZ type in Nse subunit-domain-containing protein [Dichotomocladium elegans]